MSEVVKGSGTSLETLRGLYIGMEPLNGMINCGNMRCSIWAMSFGLK